MSFDKNTWLLDSSLTKNEISDAARENGMLDGIKLADILISKSLLEPELDYFAVQFTQIEGVQYTLGLTSEGTFKWFPDHFDLGSMDVAFNDLARNAAALKFAAEDKAMLDSGPGF
jgi:hypothetical protein